jgi:hypothetical protein
VQLGPGLGTGVEHQQANRLAAIAERQHEQACAPVLAAARIADHGAGSVIDRGLFAGRGFDDGASFRRLLATEFADKALDALIAAGEAARVDQILPDGHGVAASGEPHVDGFLMGFAGAGRWTAAGMRLGFRRRLRGQLCGKVGGHLTGRF